MKRAVPLVLLAASSCTAIAGLDDLSFVGDGGMNAVDSGMGAAGGGGGDDGGVDAPGTPPVCSVDTNAVASEGETVMLSASCSDGDGDEIRYSWPDLGGWGRTASDGAMREYSSGDEYGERTGTLEVRAGSDVLTFNVAVRFEQRLDDPGSVERPVAAWWGATAEGIWPATGATDGVLAVQGADDSFVSNAPQLLPGQFYAAPFDTTSVAVPDDAGALRVTVTVVAKICSAAARRLFVRLINTNVQNEFSSLEVSDPGCSAGAERSATWASNPFAPGPWTPAAVSGRLGAGWVVNPEGPGAMGTGTVEVDRLALRIDYLQ